MAKMDLMPYLERGMSKKKAAKVEEKKEKRMGKPFNPKEERAEMAQADKYLASKKKR